MNSESEISQILKELLYNKKYGHINIELILEPTYDSHRPDIIVRAGKRNIAAIEIKSSISSKKALELFTIDFYFLFKIRYFIYTDGVKFIIFDRFQNPTSPLTTDSAVFVKKITTQIGSKKLNEIKQSAKSIFRQIINDTEFSFLELKGFFQYYGNKIEQELKLNSEYILFFSGGNTDTGSFENKFFIALLNNHAPEVIYRYSTFERIFQILNDGKIAMHGIPGMNDTTEPNYVDNYLNNSNINMGDLPTKSISMINRRFILSCTELGDNLMQWRLYGDNAKGACIKFESRLNSKTAERFFIGRVKYANDEGKHPELEFIKAIITRIREQLHLEIKFILFYVWRHFFKPSDYNYEREIRLLYIHRRREREKQWIIAEPYSIVNPMVLFNFNNAEFPLKITEVILGPNRLERFLNMTQLKQMVLEKRIPIQISESQRNVYR